MSLFVIQTYAERNVRKVWIYTIAHGQVQHNPIYNGAQKIPVSFI